MSGKQQRHDDVDLNKLKCGVAKKGGPDKPRSVRVREVGIQPAWSRSNSATDLSLFVATSGLFGGSCKKSTTPHLLRRPHWSTLERFEWQPAICAARVERWLFFYCLYYVYPGGFWTCSVVIVVVVCLLVIGTDICQEFVLLQHPWHSSHRPQKYVRLSICIASSSLRWRWLVWIKLYKTNGPYRHRRQRQQDTWSNLVPRSLNRWTLERPHGRVGVELDQDWGAFCWLFGTEP